MVNLDVCTAHGLQASVQIFDVFCPTLEHPAPPGCASTGSARSSLMYERLKQAERSISPASVKTQGICAVVTINSVGNLVILVIFKTSSHHLQLGNLEIQITHAT